MLGFSLSMGGLRGIFAGTLAACLGLALAGTAHARPMSDELRVLLDENPQILAATSDVRAAGEGVTQAFSPFLPTATLSGDKGFERVDSPARRASPGDASRLAREAATLSVRLNLFDGFAKNAGLTIAERQLDLAKVTLDSLRQRLLFEGTQVYLTLLRQRRLLALAAESEGKVQQQVRLQEQLQAQAATTEVETLLVRTRLAAAAERRLTIEAQLTELTAAYLRLFGRLPDIDALTDPGVLRLALPRGVDARVAFALENHPDIAAAALQVDIASKGRDQAQAGFYPRIDLLTEGGYERNSDATRGIRRDQKAVVEFTWRLYDGGNTPAAGRRAAYSYTATLERQKFVLDRIEEDVRKAQNQLELSRGRTRLLAETADLAEQVVRAREALLAAGRETALTVLDAEGELISAQMNLLTARFDERLAYRRLLVAMGLYTDETVFGTPAPATSDAAPADSVAASAGATAGAAAPANRSDAPVADAPGELRSTLLP